MTGSEGSACRFSQDFSGDIKQLRETVFMLYEIENLSDVSKSQSTRLFKKE